MIPSYDGRLPSLLESISSRPRLRLLRYLSTHDGPFTGRELARVVGLDPKNAAIALRQLVQFGIVNRRRAGRAYLYSLNRDNYFVNEGLVPMLLRERDWLRALGAEVAAAIGRDVESVVLYGSWARAQTHPQSDIDLLVIVRPGFRPAEADRRLTGARIRLAERFGHPISFLILTRTEFRKRLRRGEALVMEIAEQGKVLSGKPISVVVAHE